MAKKKYRKKKRENLMAGLIALIMVSSVFGVIFYGFANPSTKIKYKDYSFTQNNNYNFVTEVNNQEFNFYYLPEEALSVNVSDAILDLLKNAQVVEFTFDPEDSNLETIELIRYEILDLSQRQALDLFIIPGITSESDNYELPIITCMNATQFQPVYYFKTANETKVRNWGNCIIFEAKHSTDMLKLRDRLLYHVTGITVENDKPEEE